MHLHIGRKIEPVGIRVQAHIGRQFAPRPVFRQCKTESGLSRRHALAAVYNGAGTSEQSLGLII